MLQGDAQFVGIELRAAFAGIVFDGLSTSNVFSCYDLRHNCFVDFTGCGEHDQAYAYRVETANGDNLPAYVRQSRQMIL